MFTHYGKTVLSYSIAGPVDVRAEVDRVELRGEDGGAKFSMVLPIAEANRLEGLLRGARHERDAIELRGEVDDLDDMVAHDQPIYDRKETARELLIALLKQCDIPDLMKADEFAIAVAQRAAFLAAKLHDALEGKPAPRKIEDDLHWMVQTGACEFGLRVDSQGLYSASLRYRDEVTEKAGDTIGGVVAELRRALDDAASE